MKGNMKSYSLFEMKITVKQELFLLISSLLLTFDLAYSNPESFKYLSNTWHDQNILNRSQLFQELEEKTFLSNSRNAENQRERCVTR